MAQQEGGAGFQSAAGLMRYFDEEEDRSPKLDPRMVIVLIIAMMLIIEIAKWQWPVQ